MMLFLFTSFAQTDEDLILEANFRQAELEQLHRLAEERHYQVLTLRLQGREDILHRRYLHRIQQENRHPVHLSPRMDKLEDFAAYLQKGRENFVPGAVIDIAADDFSYQSDPALWEQIRAFLTVEAAAHS